MASAGRVALLCQHYYPEMVSTGLHMTELGTALVKQGWTVDVICAQPTLSEASIGVTYPRTMVHDGVRIRRVNALGGHSGSYLRRLIFGITFLFSTIWALFKIIGTIDVVVATTNPPFIGIASWLARVIFGRPYVMIVYDVYPDIAVAHGVLSPGSVLAKIANATTSLIMNGAERVVVIGRDMEEVVEAKVTAENRHSISLVPNWSDTATVQPVARDHNSFRDELGLDASTFVVQYSGRMGRTHNLEPVVEAAKLLQNRDVMFLFIGEGAKKARIQELAIDYGLENVRFLPYQPLDRLGEVLSAADIGVVCLETRFTGLSVPSKTYGIMASGRPIAALVDEESEIGMMIAEKRCGVVIPEPTGIGIHDALSEVIDSPNLAREMGRNARAAFLDNYTLTRAVERYDEILLSVLGRTDEE